jgi:mannose/fructose-specific phosphotransferase system component IIA
MEDNTCIYNFRNEKRAYMVNVVMASHGSLSREMLNSAQMILGKEFDRVYCLCMGDVGVAKFEEEANLVVEKIKGKDLIILADIQGGSPLMTCMSVFRDFRFIAVTGMNLPMLIEILMLESERDISKIADMAVQIASASVKAIELNIDNVKRGEIIDYTF